MRRLLAVLLTFIAILGAGWLVMRVQDIPYDTLETAYASPESRYLTLGDMRRVHYRDEGRADGPTIVLVHGFSASLHTWQGWVRELGDDYRIISLDLPGHGLTRGFPLEDVDIEGFGEVIHALTDQLGLADFTLVGSSMGGHAAWAYALERPEDLNALVLVGAAGWPPTPEELEDTPFVFKLLDNSIARLVLRDLDNTAMLRSGLEASFVDQTFVTEDMVQRYASLNRAPGHREAILHIIASREDRPLASAERLAGLTVPTLVLHGEGDNLVPFAHGEQFASAIPGAQFIAYDGVGHLPQEEITRQSAADLAAFLDALAMDRATREASAEVALGQD